MIATLALLFASVLTPVDQAGYSKLLQAQKGKVVLVNFWATWCGPCRVELPVIVSMQNRIPGLRVLTISTDEPETASRADRVLEEAKVTGPAWIRAEGDSDAFISAIDKKWSGAVPAAFLYDRNGKLVQSFIGETKPSLIEAAIRKLLR